ncbi:MAG: hypothetical protein VW378_05515 [bacterium]
MYPQLNLTKLPFVPRPKGIITRAKQRKYKQQMEDLAKAVQIALAQQVIASARVLESPPSSGQQASIESGSEPPIFLQVRAARVSSLLK